MGKGNFSKEFERDAGVAGDDRDAEIRRQKRKLAGVTEKRDILKKATAYFAKGAKRDTRLWPSIARCFQCGRCAVAYASILVAYMPV
ncbi:MAG: hypothetical protein EXR05_06275 [Acetobacteraceae bacterium]|nr:hypothetical protein [Acetobacteraceae bacterium]